MEEWVYILPLVIFVGLGLWLVPKGDKGIDSLFNSVFRKDSKLKVEELIAKAVVFHTEVPWTRIDAAIRLALTQEESPTTMRTGWSISDSDEESQNLEISFGSSILDQFTSVLAAQDSNENPVVRYEVVSYLESNGLPSGLKQMEYLQDLVISSICNIDSSVKIETAESK